MYQVAPEIWNRIAETQPLATKWAQQIFPLPPEEMMQALNREETRIAKKAGSAELAAAYIKILPLMIEAEAISQFQIQNPNLTYSLHPISSPSEGVMLASRDQSLIPSQQKRLLELLQNPET